MPQRSILSFFSSKASSTNSDRNGILKSPKADKENVEQSASDSDSPQPVKKKRRIVESDESNDATESHQPCNQEAEVTLRKTASRKDFLQKLQQKKEISNTPTVCAETKNQPSDHLSENKSPSIVEKSEDKAETSSSSKKKTKSKKETSRSTTNKQSPSNKTKKKTSPKSKIEKESSPTLKDSLESTEQKSSAKKDAQSAWAGLLGKKQNSTEESSAQDFDPSSSNYHPINDALWKKGEKVPYLALAKTLQYVEGTSGRLKMIEILSNLFRSVILLTPNDLIPCVYLCLNQLAPAYEGIELGIGETILMKALTMATGASMDKVKTESQKLGDLGAVAETVRSRQRTMITPANLTVSSVFQKLREIASMTGNASQNKKIEKIQSLLVACRQCEARYIIRSLQGKLRIGLAEQSLLCSLGQAAAITPPLLNDQTEIKIDALKGLSSESAKQKIDAATITLKSAYCECPNFDAMLNALLKYGVDDLSQYCHITPGIPMKPMLAHPTKGISEVLKRFDNADFTCEFKYDGERAQIHYLKDGSVRIYSRNQENNTSKYPDLAERIPRLLKNSTVEECIIDSEAVAWDNVAKQILPFQVLSTRKRKDASSSDIKVQVCIYAFDLLYLNGESLVRKSLRERRNLLKTHFESAINEGEFFLATSLDSSNTDEIALFLEESLKGHCEGLMVKTLDKDANYEIAKRSRNWLKLKKDYLEGVGDTLDLVVLGGFHGTGKRVGRYGGFLLACYDPDNEEYQTICKIGTGFKDEDLEQHTEFFKQHIIPHAKSYYQYEAGLTPDQWFEPVQVWEIKAADLSISPVHKAAAGLVDPEKGVSLRFPRFLRVREDKRADDATSSQQVAEMYRSQEQIKNQDPQDKDDDDFY